MIFATASRYVARRNAIVKVYWRSVEDANGVRMVKHSKRCQFTDGDTQLPADRLAELLRSTQSGAARGLGTAPTVV